MMNHYAELIAQIQAQQNKMVEQLHLWSQINSGSTHLSGLALMANTLKKAYEPLADLIEMKTLAPQVFIDAEGNETQQEFGQALLIRKRPHLKRRILLSGHMDTVYPSNSLFQTTSYLDANKVRGPGVADMKGGLIVMLQALAAFEQTPDCTELGWDVFINPDEELGSPASSKLLNQLAAHYKTALVYEPAMTPEGLFAKNRRGSGKFVLIAKGKAAHVGRAFDEGRNAICYLAEAISALDALNKQGQGITINIGTIHGGQALNMVPDKAVAQIDIRLKEPEDELWIRTEIDSIINRLKRKDYALSVSGQFGRPIKKVNAATKNLFQRVQQLGTELGLLLEWKDSGGCCDGNNLAQHGLAVLDTLGVRGGHLHSPEEYILLDSLSERACLSALLLIDLAQGSLEEINNDAFSQRERI